MLNSVGRVQTLEGATGNGAFASISCRKQRNGMGRAGEAGVTSWSRASAGAAAACTVGGGRRAAPAGSAVGHIVLFGISRGHGSIEGKIVKYSMLHYSTPTMDQGR